MADRVEEIMQDMVPELDDLRRKQIFEVDELKQIIRRRRDFEYSVITPKRPEDFLEYVRYEVAVECLRQRRSKTRGWKKLSLSDYSGVLRIHGIFHRATKKYRGNLKMLYQHIDFCLRSGSTTKLSQVLLSGMRLHPQEVRVWLLAADRELKYGHLKAARTLLMRALRFSPQSSKLYAEYFRLEVTLARRRAAQSRIAECSGVVDSEQVSGAFGTADGKDSQNNDGPAKETVEGSSTAKPDLLSTSTIWEPVRAVLKRATLRLGDSPRGFESFMNVAVRCLEEALLEGGDTPSRESLWKLAEEVDSALTSRRPGIVLGDAWDDVADETALAIWKLWVQRQRFRGESLSAVGAAVESAPPCVVQWFAAMVSDAAAFRDSAGASAKRALLSLAEAPCVLSEVDTTFAVLEALARRSGTSEAYSTLLEQACQRHAHHLRLWLLRAGASWAGPAPLSSEELARCLREVRNVDPADAARLMTLTFAEVEDDVFARDAGSVLMALLRALKRETSPQPLLKAVLSAAIWRGGACFTTICDRVALIGSDLVERPELRAETRLAVLRAEMGLTPPEGPPSRVSRHFEELLSVLEGDLRAIDVWVQYGEFVQRAEKWGCAKGLPNAAEIHRRAMRSVCNQTVYAERAHRLSQSVSA